MASIEIERLRPRWIQAFGIVLGLVGLILLLGGMQLAGLGGSWYYVIAGTATLAACVLLLQARAEGAWTYLVVVGATIIWALVESGAYFWALVPRLAPVLVLGLVAAMCWRTLHPQTRGLATAFASMQAVALIAGAFAMFTPHGVISPTTESAKGPVTAAQDVQIPAVVADASSVDNRWAYYGRDANSARFAPLQQITPENVAQLQVAWTYRTGATTGGPNEDQNTPIQVGDSVYLCTPQNKVIALDAETGAERWSFDPQAGDTKAWNRCRGVAYYDMPQTQSTSGSHCQARIITTAKNSRLYALDARTGKRCEDFGAQGEVDLSVGLGPHPDYYYMPTSQPLVAGDRVVIGGWVWDGRQTEEPSGVVRAYDLHTGELAWAWDLGNPEITLFPPEGKTYTKGTPNYWSSGSYDPQLDMVFLPLGNATPDFWGAHRTAAMNRYASAMVALHADTGREAWHFQGIHMDTWDYDNGTPPLLLEMPDGKGSSVPAVVMATKTHQLFVLDRRSGKPVADVRERPAPQKVQAGDAPASPTQPWSVGMPQIAAMDLKESDMWGATMFDQLYCRIQFKKMHYQGPYTKLTTERTLIYPGYYGGFNWGGIAFDPRSKYLIVNDMRMPQQGFLSPQAEAKEALARLKSGDRTNANWATHVQEGTPYQSIRGAFNSFLGLPCHQPSWGNLTAIDMNTKQIAWQVPLGTVEDSVVHGIRFGLPMPVGMPSLSGPFATAGGLVFYAGTQDYYLRAFDSASGKELWKGRLPVGAQATPMTYLSPASGRQFVVVSAGGARMTQDRGDYVVAYALPKSSNN